MPLVGTAQEAAGREAEVLCRFAFETRVIRGRGCCGEPHQPGQGLLRSVNDNIVRFVESQFQQTLRGPPLRSGSSSSDWRGNIKARETAELKARMADLVGQLPPCILYLTRSGPWIRPLTVRFDAGARRVALADRRRERVGCTASLNRAKRDGPRAVQWSAVGPQSQI